MDELGDNRTFALPWLAKLRENNRSCAYSQIHCAVLVWSVTVEFATSLWLPTPRSLSHFNYYYYYYIRSKCALETHSPYYQSQSPFLSLQLPIMSGEDQEQMMIDDWRAAVEDLKDNVRHEIITLTNLARELTSIAYPIAEILEQHIKKVGLHHADRCTSLL